MFEDYAVIPLDLPQPPVDADALRRFLQQYCERCAFTGNVIRYVLFFGRKPIVDGRLLLNPSDPRFDAADENTRFEWDPVFRDRFPELIAWFDMLPLTR